MMQDTGSVIALPPPETEGGRPLMNLLRDRCSRREFSDRPLSPQMLSNLLWAAIGINRPESGKLTVPNSRERHEIDLFVIMAGGAYLYDNRDHALRTVLNEDIRPLAGKQDFVAGAPVNLVFVANYAKMPELNPEQQLVYSSTDVGFSVQNVYLFCISAGLATVTRGSIDREALGKALGLGPQQRIILGQSVAYPATAQ